MSLRERILVILLILFCGYIAIEYVTYRLLMYPEFVQQEQRQAEASVEAALNTITAPFSDFVPWFASLARSGDFHEVLQSQGRGLSPHELSDMDFVILYDTRWNAVRSKVPEGLTVSSLTEQLVGDMSAFVCQNRIRFSRSGLVRINGRYAYAAAEPILQTATSVNASGTAIAGRFVTEDKLCAIRKQAHFNFDLSWEFLADETVRDNYAEILGEIRPQSTFHFSIISKDYFQASTVLFDYANQPAILVKTFHGRTFSKQGMWALYKLLAIKLGIGLAGVVFLTVLLQISIIKPILNLIRHIVAIEYPGSDTKQMVALSRKDEIGTLAAEFNQMCRRVQNAQIKLMEKSYLSGVTEMSSGILHNVRNALSPITTRIERFREQFHQIPLEHLEQAQRELRDETLDAQRRTDMVRFVELSFETVLNNLKEMVTGLDELFEQVVQIEDMLNTQRTFGSKQAVSVEFIEPSQLLNNALEMVPEKFRKKNRLEISSGIKKLPAIPVYPTTFVQILQNLLINASESLEREKTLYPKISVECRVEPNEEVDMLHWYIRDNGAGIDADRLESIFERGASSKSQGLTGIGLHWCAVTVNAMRGRLWAESEGAHRGACFHLVIPMAAQESPAEPVACGKEH